MNSAVEGRLVVTVAYYDGVNTSGGHLELEENKVIA